MIIMMFSKKKKQIINSWQSSVFQTNYILITINKLIQKLGKFIKVEK
jgi:hypothetical protein